MLGLIIIVLRTYVASGAQPMSKSLEDQFVTHASHQSGRVACCRYRRNKTRDPPPLPSRQPSWSIVYTCIFTLS